MSDEILFPNREGWMPTWWECVSRMERGSPTPSERALLYRAIGFDALPLEDYPNINAHKAELSEIFDKEFATRMVNRETLPAWQVSMERVLYDVGPKYDRAFAMYSQIGTDLEETLGDTVTTYNNLTDRHRTLNTPDTPTDWDHGYSEDRSENVRSGGFTVSQTLPGGEVESVNLNLDSWRNLKMEFVREFRRCFLNIFRS